MTHPPWPTEDANYYPFVDTALSITWNGNIVLTYVRRVSWELEELCLSPSLFVYIAFWTSKQYRVPSEYTKV